MNRPMPRPAPFDRMEHAVSTDVGHVPYIRDYCLYEADVDIDENGEEHLIWRCIAAEIMSR
jgi:hypothetical protein